MAGPAILGIFTEPLSACLQWLFLLMRIIPILAGGFTGPQRGKVTFPKLMPSVAQSWVSFCQSSWPLEGEEIDSGRVNTPAGIPRIKKLGKATKEQERPLKSMGTGNN